MRPSDQAPSQRGHGWSRTLVSVSYIWQWEECALWVPSTSKGRFSFMRCSRPRLQRKQTWWRRGVVGGAYVVQASVAFKDMAACVALYHGAIQRAGPPFWGHWGSLGDTRTGRLPEIHAPLPVFHGCCASGHVPPCPIDPACCFPSKFTLWLGFLT